MRNQKKKENSKHIIQHYNEYNTLLCRIDIISEVQINIMEKSKKEVIIYYWQNQERFFGGGTFEIDVQEGEGLTDSR